MREAFENITSGRLSGKNHPPFPLFPQVSRGKGDIGGRFNRMFVQNKLIRVSRFMGCDRPVEGS
jgi:hypothetical protein